MRRTVSALICLAVWSAVGVTAHARQTVPPLPAPEQDYLFTSGAGLLLFHVRPELARDFEYVLGRLHDALDQPRDAVRRDQAVSWRTFRSLERPRESVVYLCFFDPAVAGADYDPVRLLGEVFPAEAQALYDRLRAATIRVERMGLARLR